MSNVFGLDRSGFRALVLLPTPRRYILLAKNLAFFPFVAGIGFVLLMLARFLLRMPWTIFLAGLIQVVTAFMLFALASNLLATLVPYRMAPGTLQAKKPKPIIFVGVFAMMLSLPLVALLVLIPAGLQVLFIWRGWAAGLPAHLLAALALLFGTALLYWALLPLEGKLLQRREQAILSEVTEEVE